MTTIVYQKFREQWVDLDLGEWIGYFAEFALAGFMIIFFLLPVAALLTPFALVGWIGSWVISALEN